MKKIILTLAFGLFFVAFSNAQSTKTTKEEVKKEYTVEKSKSATAEATPSCHGKKAAKACCAGKKAKATSCAGKSKASCAGKSKASCSGKSKAAATKETL